MNPLPRETEWQILPFKRHPRWCICRVVNFATLWPDSGLFWVLSASWALLGFSGLFQRLLDSPGLFLESLCIHLFLFLLRFTIFLRFVLAGLLLALFFSLFVDLGLGCAVNLPHLLVLSSRY